MFTLPLKRIKFLQNQMDKKKIQDQKTTKKNNNLSLGV